ncbi:hypothetical protein COV42_00320 [Candidatus Campbellbacteria bacterium CG11_big_fil_rev_8_21_14_0_20_44_21]|uniref:CARDB domain-containing protein n=1 Tax=Candidatus Campbellbacteria bacterium CG22_combo_CG10-13_8_21_14_all_43_18 TaxID=1974530 RepID=A0A2H0DWR4_9BACT|nr:MAG: hypothetical protein COW82_01025 [Candidatus Campbellbacteria bacterium CG22_combo_CG10-13_8_21_14_all_43_18]PIR24521.1 MAG: hypothetical protein COV42_00320 [Candidatus Campbellbacteria bacterium CG11_big_fil_rev_8_21_14_0_20_44_21]
MKNNKNQFQDSIVKILAVVGAIAVLSVGGFITVTVLKNIPDIFGNIAAQVVSITQRFIPAERIIVTLSDENPVNGDLVRLSFEHQNKNDDGSYSFFYECREGVHFERAASDEVIFCNTPYNFINQDNTFSFRVFSAGEGSSGVPLSVNFVQNNSERISERGQSVLNIRGEKNIDSTMVIIRGGEDGNRPAKRTPGQKIEEEILFNQTSGSTAGVSNPNGIPDLKATILAVGRIDRETNVFTATSSIPQADRGAVKFEILNVGTKSTGSWHFNVVVPTFPAFIYHSKSQPSLLPGDKIEYTIGFDSIKNDGAENVIVVNADPIGSIKESLETNNIVKSVLPAYNIE